MDTLYKAFFTREKKLIIMFVHLKHSEPHLCKLCRVIKGDASSGCCSLEGKGQKESYNSVYIIIIPFFLGAETER